jgi:hypothetical protein
MPRGVKKENLPERIRSNTAVRNVSVEAKALLRTPSATA